METQELQVLDLVEAMERVEDDRELFLELIEIMLQQFPQGFEEMNAGIAKADGAALRSAAHTLKGALANLGAKRAAAVAYQIEKAGLNSQIAEATPMVQKLAQEFELVKKEFEAFRASK